MAVSAYQLFPFQQLLGGTSSPYPGLMGVFLLGIHSVLRQKYLPFVSVVDPDPDDPYVLGLLDPDPLVRGTDPDPSIIKQK
jgi:hypothetical protein